MIGRVAAVGTVARFSVLWRPVQFLFVEMAALALGARLFVFVFFGGPDVLDREHDGQVGGVRVVVQDGPPLPGRRLAGHASSCLSVGQHPERDGVGRHDQGTGVWQDAEVQPGDGVALVVCIQLLTIQKYFAGKISL